MAISVLHTTASNSLTTTIPSTSPGSCLIVCIMPFSGTGTSSVSGVTVGGSADNFAQAAGVGTNQSSAFIWADPNCASGQTSVVVAGSNLLVATTDGGIVIYEVAGLALTSVVDKTQISSLTSGSLTYTTGTTPTTTAPNELVVGCASVGGSPSSPAGYTSTINTGNFSIAGQKIVSSTGTFIYNGTSSNGPYGGAIATFKAADSPNFSKPVNVNQAVNRSAVW